MQNLNIITTLPLDVTLLYLHNLDNSELNKVRLISKDFKKIIDTNEHCLYRFSAFELKNRYVKLVGLEITIEEQKANEYKLLNDFKIPLKMLGYLGLKSKIEKKMTKKIINEIEIAQKSGELLTTEYLLLGQKYYEKMAFEKIMGLFGGKEKFDAIPFLRTFESLDVDYFIDVSEKFVRGVDTYERNFIILNVAESYIKIYQDYDAKSVWYMDQNDYSHMIINYKGEETAMYLDLAEYIRRQVFK